MSHLTNFSTLMIILLLYVEAHIFILETIEKFGIYYRIMFVLPIIHVLISCRLDYYNSLLYNVPAYKTDRLQRLQNQCARILTNSPRREHIAPVKNKIHWLKIQDRITYEIFMLTYKSYYNIVLTYLCELISRRERSVNTRLGADHQQPIMPPISKDCSNTFLERSFIYAAPCEWNKLREYFFWKEEFYSDKNSTKSTVLEL